MPPELEAFIQTFGRLPSPGIQGEIELLNFRNRDSSLLGPIFSPPMGLPGGAPEPIGSPSDTVLPLLTDLLQLNLRTFQTDAQPPLPTAGQRRGIPFPPLGDTPETGGPIFTDQIPGAPGGPVAGPLPSTIAPPGTGTVEPGFGGEPEAFGAVTDPTLGSQIQGILSRLDQIDTRLSSPAQEVARARLGGGPGGFSFQGGGVQPPGQPTAAPLLQGGPQFGAGSVTPNVGPTGSGQVLSALGQQQQADVANQQAQAASVLSSLIGGVGGLVGGLAGGGGGGGGPPLPGGGGAPQQPQVTTVSPFQDRLRRASTLRSSQLGRVF